MVENEKDENPSIVSDVNIKKSRSTRKFQKNDLQNENSFDIKDITKEELLDYYEEHVNEFERIILKYDQLSTPELFESSVELFKISSETQLNSDIEYIKWIVLRYHIFISIRR